MTHDDYGTRGRRARRMRRMKRHEYDDYDSEPVERGRLYRGRRGMIFGVCKGFANYNEFPVFWTRVAAVCIALFTGWLPAIGFYLIAALVMKPEPVLPLESEEDEEFYHSFTASRPMALHRLKRTYDNLDHRIQRIENAVTARDYDWEERLKS